MNKAIKLVMTGLLVSANMLAQETDSIQQYGRGISVDWKESTTAGGMVTAVQLLLPYPRSLLNFLYLHAAFLPAPRLKAMQGYLLRLVYIRNRRLLAH